MKYTYNSKLHYDSAVDTTHRVEIDLDLDIDGLLAGKDIAADLLIREQEIRKQIFDLVLDGVLFESVKKTGVDWEIPGEWSSKFDNQINNKWNIKNSEINNESIDIRNKINVICDIAVDRPVNAIQAVRSANKGIASLITDTIINALKLKFLGVHKVRTHTNAHSDGNLTADATNIDPPLN